jgi:hypothetical protein
MAEIAAASLMNEIDMNVYLGSSTEKATFDVSAGQMVFDNAELHMGDDDAIEFGDTSGGDAFIEWEGTNNFLMLGFAGVGGFAFDDSAITGFTAATDTAGKDVFAETQDAGGTATAGRAGGSFRFTAGTGSAGATAVAGGEGGGCVVLGGEGGAASGTAAAGKSGILTLQVRPGGAHTGGGASGAGGAGGALSLTGGVGGATSNVGSDNGGAGTAVSVTCGAGGLASAGTGDGGAGGDLTLTAGAGGTSSGGVAGAPGDVVVGAGVFRQSVQTILMNDTTVTLTLVPGTPTGTLLTGNVLYVDAEGNTETLKLPPEADCTGLQLTVVNTGGETINIHNDADSLIVANETANTAIVACDGTTWRGLVGIP